MALGFEATQRLFQAGRYRELLSESGGSINSALTTPEHRLLVALAMLHTGDVAGATDIARRESLRHAAPAIRSRCEIVLGMACRQRADLDGALNHYHHAVQSAKDARDACQTAWAALHVFRLRAELEPAGELGTLLDEVRGYVTKAGDPH